jgi:hypothetical protein
MVVEAVQELRAATFNARTTGKERRITRWQQEHALEAAQKRLDRNPQAMRQRRETVEQPFGTLKMRMGATHFLMKRLSKVASEMALHVAQFRPLAERVLTPPRPGTDIAARLAATRGRVRDMV